MKMKSWLFAWIGETDHRCAEGAAGDELGPIASAIQGLPPLDRIYLLTNYPHGRSDAYCRWLQQRAGGVPIDLHEVELKSPIDYADIYRAVSAELRAARLPAPGVEPIFHLSPGTPAMTAIWIILAKTRFPARLIQTSVKQGMQWVDFDFDLASDFLPEFLKRTSDRIERLADRGLDDAPGFHPIVHQCAEMREQIDLARRIAAHDVPVLVLGETGTGKELFAEAIHASSQRAQGPFISINCGAIPHELINSELFGHRKGAFTGAIADRKGVFSEAHGGTLFLDEVGDLPLDAQVRLLRAIQQREVAPVGASLPERMDVRIVAATHKDLGAEVSAGRFREDLFHRLAVGILELPPLRARNGDIGLLIDHYLDKVNSDAAGKPEWQRKKLSPVARNVMLVHGWPGNVRELYHTLLRAAIWSRTEVIEATDVERAIIRFDKPKDPILDRVFVEGFDLQAILDEVSRHYMSRAMSQTGNRKKRAAALLGISNYQTLGNRLQKLGLDSSEEESD